MVCDDCTRKLSTLSAPDPWKMAGGSASGGVGGATRRIDENKALRKGIRSNPYGNCCKICKMKVQQNHATYCTQCAYAKGICAICGKQVLDTSMYKMSEGGLSMHKPGGREEAAFKSAEQLAREAAQNELFDYLQSTGQVGRMPTRAALETAGRGALAAALVTSFGGLNAAADAMGLSKKLLTDEAEERKVAKREAAQQKAAQREEQQRLALEQQQLREQQGEGAEGAEGADAAPEDDDLPPGVALPAAGAPPPVADAPAVAAVAPPPPPPRVIADPRWQYDPNTGLYFQLSTQCYFDAGKSLYHKNGAWSREKPA